MTDFMRVILIIVFFGIIPATLIGLFRELLGISPPTEEELRRRMELNRMCRESEKRSAIMRTSFKVAQDSVYSKEYLDKNPAVRIEVAQHLTDYENALHK